MSDYPAPFPKLAKMYDGGCVGDVYLRKFSMKHIS